MSLFSPSRHQYKEDAIQLIQKVQNMGNENRQLQISKGLAKNRVGEIFHMRDIWKNVIPKFIKLCKEMPFERHKYSLLPITRTFKGNRKKVRVIASSKKIAEINLKNSFYCTMNILITFNCRNVK